MILTYLKIGLAIGLAALIAFGTWYATSDHYEKLIAQKQILVGKAVQAQLQANQDLLAANAALRSKAEENHAKDQLVVNDLTARLDGVRVHIPTCRGAMPTADATSKNPDGGCGLLSDRVDAAFERLQEGVGVLILRCAQLNIDAIQSNNAVSR